MSTVAVVNDLRAIDIPLENIYLDPNNPRFVQYNWAYTQDEGIASEAVQDATRLRLTKEFEIEKLKMNMEVNGYLPIDRVIVRQFADEQYVVLEGNRRICAAKLISSYAADGTAVSPEVLESLQTIPCLLYIGQESNAAWIFQGLRHITGYRDWSAFNKAKLLVEQMQEGELNLTTVGKRFGLTPFGAGQWVRGYFAFLQASESSDYITEVDERAYPYFQELFSRSSAKVREWMDWDESDKKFKDDLNFNEFLSWLYPRSIDEDPMNDVMNSDEIKPGEWERRVLRNRDDIRQVAYLLREDTDAFEKFRRDLDVERAYAEAVSRKYEQEAKESSDPTAEVFQAISACTRALDNIPHKVIRNAETKIRLLSEIKALENAIALLRE